MSKLFFALASALDDFDGMFYERFKMKHKTTMKDRRHIMNDVIREIIGKFDFHGVREHMLRYGCHPGYNVRKGEAPPVEELCDVAAYVLGQLLDSDEETVFIQDFVALRKGDEVVLLYPTIGASALTHPQTHSFSK